MADEITTPEHALLAAAELADAEADRAAEAEHPASCITAHAIAADIRDLLSCITQAAPSGEVERLRACEQVLIHVCAQLGFEWPRGDPYAAIERLQAAAHPQPTPTGSEASVVGLVERLRIWIADECWGPSDRDALRRLAGDCLAALSLPAPAQQPVDVERVVAAVLDAIHRVSTPVTHGAAMAAAEDGVRSCFAARAQGTREEKL